MTHEKQKGRKRIQDDTTLEGLVVLGLVLVLFFRRWLNSCWGMLDGLALFGDRLGDKLVEWWLDDGDHVGEGLLGAELAFWVVSLHDLNLDTQYTLLEENVSDGVVNKVASGLTGVDHESVGEFHGFGAGGAELARDDNLTTLGTGLHDESENTVACPADGKPTKELVPQALALGNSRETTALDLLGVELEGVFGELEPLLDERGELADAATLLTEDFLSVGGTDDDFGTGVRNADLTPRVTLLCQLAGEELAQLGAEHTVGHELSLLADLSRHFEGFFACGFAGERRRPSA